LTRLVLDFALVKPFVRLRGPVGGTAPMRFVAGPSGGSCGPAWDWPSRALGPRGGALPDIWPAGPGVVDAVLAVWSLCAVLWSSRVVQISRPVFHPTTISGANSQLTFLSLDKRHPSSPFCVHTAVIPNLRKKNRLFLSKYPQKRPLQLQRAQDDPTSKQIPQLELDKVSLRYLNYNQTATGHRSTQMQSSAEWEGGDVARVSMIRHRRRFCAA
jgi:hypothetical protein